MSNEFTLPLIYSSFRIKPSPPSPAVEAVDDFDPRSGESNNDFGDFRSAPTIATTTKSAQPSNTSSDFADFQSAFGSSPPPPASTVATPVDPLSSLGQTGPSAQSDDLLGLNFDAGSGGSAGQSSGLSSLNSAAPSAFLPQLGGSIGNFSTNSGVSSAAMARQQPVSLPGAFPPVGIPANNFQQTPSPVVQFPTGGTNNLGSMGFPTQQAPLVQTAVPSSQPMSLTSLSPNNDALDLFGSSTGVPATPVLQPATKASNGAIPSNSASNNMNNNSNPSLKVCFPLPVLSECRFEIWKSK